MQADLNNALNAAQAYRDAARRALVERLALHPIDREQRAAHGFAWVATTVAALEAVLAWCESGQNSNPLDAFDAKVAVLAFAEGIGQLVGGLPMGQNEIFRPADLGLGVEARALADSCAGLLDTDQAATRGRARRCTTPISTRSASSIAASPTPRSCRARMAGTSPMR